jgi:K+ transporter
MQFNLLNFIVFISYIIVSVALSVRLVIFSKRNKQLAELLIQSQIENSIYMDRLIKEMEEKESLKLQKTDGFLNFVSQSRDWAYEYIEEVQNKLKEVFTVLDNKTEKKTVKQILGVVESLREMLPEEREDKNG